MVIPGRPVADHEVSASMPAKSTHRRNRHAPLLQATEWIKAMYHQSERHPTFKTTAEIIGYRGDAAELPSNAVSRSPASTTAEKRRGICIPQALRTDTTIDKCNVPKITFDSFLKQTISPEAVTGEVDLCDDGEVSPLDKSRPLYKRPGDNAVKSGAASGMSPETLQFGNTAENHCEVEGSTVAFHKSSPAPAGERSGKVDPASKEKQAILPALPADGKEKSSPTFQVARKPLPSPTDKDVKAEPTSPEVIKVMSSINAENARIAGLIPRIDHGPVNKSTALNSHPPSEEERTHSIWLNEGWKIWKSKKTITGGLGGSEHLGERPGSKATIKPFQGGLKGLFKRR